MSEKDRIVHQFVSRSLAATGSALVGAAAAVFIGYGLAGEILWLWVPYAAGVCALFGALAGPRAVTWISELMH